MQTDQVVDCIICMAGNTLEHLEACGERWVLSVKELAKGLWVRILCIGKDENL